jgi:hypothetical protein
MRGVHALCRNRAGLTNATVAIQGVFAFFSNRLGCLGSIVVSVIGTIVLLALMRGCSGGMGGGW